ncbi:hypothetical protein QBC34DRAFT_410533 [Podospora aff. communis PSN243]|uniref:Uncharacterized protein n=1 Tax=Podospora aff. communis PSN243 TaxID=3040156 RepID=A0AAV9GGZ2_9PEZI|nr:hypothetical protein QBC34DRAFT_410533 [Podospora aff. communis PSN243]
MQVGRFGYWKRLIGLIVFFFFFRGGCGSWGRTAAGIPGCWGFWAAEILIGGVFILIGFLPISRVRIALPQAERCCWGKIGRLHAGRSWSRPWPTGIVFLSRRWENGDPNQRPRLRDAEAVMQPKAVQGAKNMLSVW